MLFTRLPPRRREFCFAPNRPEIGRAFRPNGYYAKSCAQIVRAEETAVKNDNAFAAGLWAQYLEQGTTYILPGDDTDQYRSPLHQLGLKWPVPNARSSVKFWGGLWGQLRSHCV